MCETPAVALHSYPDSKAFRVECEACNVNGPLLTTAEQAIEAWNTRPADHSMELVKALEHICEYWNGSPDAAVDAIEHAIETATEAIELATGKKGDQ
jgi:hypothetical protein